MQKIKTFIFRWSIHIPKYYEQLLINLFKDIISSLYLIAFFILMSNKTEVLYDVIFKSIYNILNQKDIYNLDFDTISTDTEIALINGLNYNFKNFCRFHLNKYIINVIFLYFLFKSYIKIK